MDESIKQRIIEFNNQFGIKTEFVTQEDVMGYALGNTIYINESVQQDYEKTSRHELLHFFEETPEFEVIKKRLLEEHADKLNDIRSEYELRYFGLYSEEEIKAGVLDTEIAIDMMVDNSSFEYEDGLKIGDDFLGQIQHSIEEKRYLNLSLTANIMGMNLSDWEKIFVLNYYDGKERRLPQGKGTDRVQAIRGDIEKYLQELYELDETSMQIDSHSPEVIREYESEIKALKARGEDTFYLESDPEMGYEEIARRISEQLYAEYKHIVDLMKGLDIEHSFKSMMLRETLTKVYKLDRDNETNKGKTIVKNRKLNESIAGHMILNESTLQFIYEHIASLDEFKNFANLYFAAVEIYKNAVAEKCKITLEGVETYGKGTWIKFDGKGTDEEHYLENAKKLAALVQDTPWCTKQLASSQLVDGDFYVFVDNEGKPHIAVKMEGNAIDEVRGIQNGNAQELEEEYRDVALSLLENNKEIKNGKKWFEKEEWNKRLIECIRKIDSGEFTVDDVPMLLADLYETKDYRNHGVKNSNKIALCDRLEQILPFLAEHFKCMEYEICIGNVQFLPSYDEEDEDLYYNPPDPFFVSYGEEEPPYYREYGEEVPYKVILGDVDFTLYRGTDTEGLIFIGGDVDFSGNRYTRSSMIQKIMGSVNFGESIIRELPMLQSIGGNADFIKSLITELPKLQSIGKSAYFSESIIRELLMLQSIGGNANFIKSLITALPMLQSIGENAYFEESPITALPMLQSIGGDAFFGNSRIRRGRDGRPRSKEICEPSLITSLNNLRSIAGDAFFDNSRITDFGPLESIGGNAYFNGLGNVNIEQTIQVGGTAYFDSEEQIEECGEKICATSKKVGTGETINRRRRRGRPLEEDRQRTGEELEELMKIAQRQRQGDFIEFANGVPSIDTVLESEGPETEVRGDE